MGSRSTTPERMRRKAGWNDSAFIEAFGYVVDSHSVGGKVPRDKLDEMLCPLFIDGTLSARTAAVQRGVRMEIEEGVQDVKLALEQFRRVSNTLGEEVAGFIPEFREKRMTLLRETHQVLTAIKEIRAFFLSNDHEKELKRLTNFLDICDRLKTLKDDGTLDAIADIVLKTGVRHEGQ